LLTLCLARPGWAQPSYPAIVDRDYAIDLFQGTAVGAPRTLAMGGTATALGEGAEGMVTQPAAVANRPRSAQGEWDWDGTINGSVPSLGSDINNHANPSLGSASVRSASAAILGLHGPYGVGISYFGTAYRLSSGEGTSLEFQSGVARIAVGRAFLDRVLVPAIALRFGAFSLARAQGETLFDATGANLEVGVIVNHPERPARYGVRWSAPVKAAQLNSRCPNPFACEGYILPSRAAVPWELALGAAWRFGQPDWNQATPARFVDEPALTLAVDLLLSGGVDRATGIEPFANHVLQPSGQGLSLALRAGAELELLPGWLRVLGGTYLEPARFAGSEVRLHGTAGAEARLFAFELFGTPRRLALSVAFDVARRYGNAGFSLGFWH
jgi:hypothetical protein